MIFFYTTFALYFLIFIGIISSFTPDKSSFDAYGLKLAVNDILLVESLSSDSSFLLRLAPFNYSLSCTIPYNDSNQYVFAVALHRQATYNDNIRFVFIGVHTKTNQPFIGSLTYAGVSGPTYISTINSSRKIVFPCDGWTMNNYRIHYFYQFGNDNDFFVVTVGPTGRFAYALTKTFLFMYDLDLDFVSAQLGNLTWPDPSFLPHAVDVNRDLLIVVLGYVGDSSSKYTPCAYLLNISHSIFHVLDTWLYTPPTDISWQATLTNWDADDYAPKYDMSLSINSAGDQVLFGIQIMNSIILIDIDRINQKFGMMIQTLSNGKAIGMGKSVGWMIETNLILILVNTYSLNYVWSSSQVFAYNITVPNTFFITSIFPNIQQTLSPTFGPILLSLVITQNGTVVMLDSQGNYYILLPSPAGSYSDSSSGTSSSSSLCLGGTFTSEFDILPCSLCPPGTTTSGLIGQSMCTSCANDSFCPLGAAFGNISLSSPVLLNINQARAYPISPQSIRFDNILIQNMFQIHKSSSSHCLIVSPLFWTMIVISFGIFIWLLMFIFKRYVTSPTGKKTHKQIKEFLKKTDLIGEGEMVIGGLFSFAIIVLVAFAYTFSNSYFHRYPIEQITEDANFACDRTLTNAQFTSGLMATGIPPNDDEAPMFALLDAQLFTLHIHLINTLSKCTEITVTQVKDRSLPIIISSCNNSDYGLSFSLILPSHTIRLQVLVAGTNTIGAFRIGLEGSGLEMENESLNAVYTLMDLSFAQTFSVPNRLLVQQPSCTFELTKVMNRTYSLEAEGETQFNALWLPTFSGSLDEMFVDENEYKYATSTSTVLSILISETPYYMLNTQKPITDQDELIFANLLFTIVCLEIFGLGFLIFKLIIFPLIGRILGYCQRRRLTKNSAEKDFDLPQTFKTRM